MSAKVAALADMMLGQPPLRRKGRFPKLALIYRHAAEDKVANVSKHFSDADGQSSLEHGMQNDAARQVVCRWLSGIFAH